MSKPSKEAIEASIKIVNEGSARMEELGFLQEVIQSAIEKGVNNAMKLLKLLPEHYEPQPQPATAGKLRETLLRELLQEMIDCYVSINDLPEEFARKVKDAVKESEQLSDSGAASSDNLSGGPDTSTPDRSTGVQQEQKPAAHSGAASSDARDNPALCKLAQRVCQKWLPKELAVKGQAAVLEALSESASGAASSEPQELEARITAYLASGGLFNPEMALHDRVRDLLIECRAALKRGRNY